MTQLCRPFLLYLNLCKKTHVAPLIPSTKNYQQHSARSPAAPTKQFLPEPQKKRTSKSSFFRMLWRPTFRERPWMRICPLIMLDRKAFDDVVIRLVYGRCKERPGFGSIVGSGCYRNWLQKISGREFQLVYWELLDTEKRCISRNVLNCIWSGSVPLLHESLFESDSLNFHGWKKLFLNASPPYHLFACPPPYSHAILYLWTSDSFLWKCSVQQLSWRLC